MDFSKKILNSSKFRPSAIHYQLHKSYCLFPYGTTEYVKFWEEETDRCLHGYTAEDGDYITGYFYFYLNYCPILRLYDEEYKDRHGKKRTRRVRDREFPDFYDYDYFYFQYIDECEEGGYHGSVLKSRGKGYSFKGGAMLCRNYFLVPGSKSYAVAAEAEYLTKDGLLTKAWEFMDFIDKNTAWAKKRSIDRTTHKRAGVMITDELGNKTEQGYLSEIIGVTLKDNPDRIRGKRGKLILWEEAGMFKNILTAWQIARPGVEESGYAFGLMVAFGTGGSEGEDFKGLRELFYSPAGHNVHSIPNIWDENVADSKCGFFCPAWSNMTTQGEDGKRIYMDEDGNSLYNEAMEFVLKERQVVLDNAVDNNAVDRYIAELPTCPQEACLEISGNIFPKKELQQQLTAIRTNKRLQNHKQVGDLVWGANGTVEWQQKKRGDITVYPLKREDDPTGSIVIWEHPMSEPPVGLYIAGCLLPGEQVMTDVGLMNVEDIDYSRRLVNKDGQSVQINALLRYEKFDTNTYELKMSNTHRTTTFTGEHPIYVSKTPYNTNLTINEGKFDFDFKPVKDISAGDWIKVPNMYAEEKVTSSLEFVDSPDFWRFIGMWLGDGWCESDGCKIAMAFNASEWEYKNAYIDLVARLFDRKTYCRKRGNMFECTFCMKELNSYLNLYFGKGADGKCIPEWAKYISHEKKLKLLQGYLDTDGCVTKNSKGYYALEYVSINLKMLEAVQDIAFSIGFVSNLSKMRDASIHLFGSHVSKTRACYHLRFGHTDSIKFASMFEERECSKTDKIAIDAGFKTRTRGKNGCFISECGKYIYFQIRDIKTDMYTGTVYNFDCETHTYMCHHITTHNCDPYDHDQAGTNSLGSMFVYKRFQGFEAYHDILVAEYTGRPANAEEYYENVRKLLVYYNARLLYENERKGIFPYFTNKHCDYLLADQPDIINDIIGNSKVQRRKGIHMTKQIRDYGEGLIKEWLNEEYEPGKKNLTTIFSEPLLEELIQTNGKMNVDRVIALIMVMIYREQLHNQKVKEIKEEVTRARVFDVPLFSTQWWAT